MSSNASYIAEPVWVSSREHLASFGKLLADTPWYMKLLGRVNVPQGFPQVASASRVTPIVYLSRGTLTVLDSIITYQDRQDDQYDLKSLPIQTAKLSTLSKVSYRISTRPCRLLRILIKWPSWADSSRSSCFSSYRINWIELSVPSIRHPVLLCVGTQEPSMSRIKEDTDQLLEELRSRIANR